MVTEDVINGLFESVGAVLSWLNVRKLLRDHAVVGVYWPVTGFFGSWGLWNLWYYSSLGHWFSWGAGVFLASANILWAVMAYRYTR